VRLPAAIYVKSARFGANDAMKESIIVGSNVRDVIDIVIADDTGGIKATVIDAAGKPYDAATVVLVPDESTGTTVAYYKTGTSDSAGSIAIKGIPPGDYTLFAWEYIDAGAGTIWTLFASKMPNGVAVTIDPGREVDVRIRAAEPK
jgi:hypothetical protein